MIQRLKATDNAQRRRCKQHRRFCGYEDETNDDESVLVLLVDRKGDKPFYIGCMMFGDHFPLQSYHRYRVICIQIHKKRMKRFIDERKEVIRKMIQDNSSLSNQAATKNGESN